MLYFLNSAKFVEFPKILKKVENDLFFLLFRAVYDEEGFEKRMTYSELQNFIREESGDDGAGVDCCPVTEEMTQPEGGVNREGMYVELFRNGEIAQRYFEYSCKPDILDKPCRFIDRKLAKQSRCVQKYSYTYAIVQHAKVAKIIKFREF